MLQYTIEVNKVLQKEILLAFLAEAGCEGFEEFPDRLVAIDAGKGNDAAIKEILKDYDYTVTEVAERNWNEEWEKNFQPVIVEGFCTVKATFHTLEANTRFNVIITPKMSFGTGHHATTYLMVKQMQFLNLQEKKVLDYGTGTGILAILAEKMGAEAITAIDIDKWSIENSMENFAENNCNNIAVFQTGIEYIEGEFDIILANINRNVLLETMHEMAQRLNKGGIVYLSGLLTGDIPLIKAAMANNSLRVTDTDERNGWCFLKGEKL